MENIINAVSLLAGFIPLIIAFNAFLTKIGLPTRFAPIVNLLLGFIAFPVVKESFPIYQSILACLVIGLSAGGFYDLGKKTILNQ